MSPILSALYAPSGEHDVKSPVEAVMRGPVVRDWTSPLCPLWARTRSGKTQVSGPSRWGSMEGVKGIDYVDRGVRSVQMQLVQEV